MWLTYLLLSWYGLMCWQWNFDISNAEFGRVLFELRSWLRPCPARAGSSEEWRSIWSVSRIDGWWGDGDPLGGSPASVYGVTHTSVAMGRIHICFWVTTEWCVLPMLGFSAPMYSQCRVTVPCAWSNCSTEPMNDSMTAMIYHYDLPLTWWKRRTDETGIIEIILIGIE